MSDPQPPDSGKLRLLHPPRSRRRTLPAWLRHVLVATLGMLVALGSFYLLRKLGY